MIVGKKAHGHALRLDAFVPLVQKNAVLSDYAGSGPLLAVRHLTGCKRADGHSVFTAFLVRDSTVAETDS